MTRGPLVLALLAWAGTAQATCPDLEQSLVTAEDAVRDLDVGALQTAMATIRTAVDCAPGPITPVQAARVHRALGIGQFIDGEEATAQRTLEASRALDDSLGLGTSIGGPLGAAWDRAAPTSSPKRSPLPAPKSGALWVDGTQQDSAPTHLPYILQQVDGDLTQGTMVAA